MHPSFLLSTCALIIASSSLAAPGSNDLARGRPYLSKRSHADRPSLSEYSIDNGADHLSNLYQSKDSNVPAAYDGKDDKGALNASDNCDKEANLDHDLYPIESSYFNQSEDSCEDESPWVNGHENEDPWVNNDAYIAPSSTTPCGCEPTFSVDPTSATSEPCEDDPSPLTPSQSLTTPPTGSLDEGSGGLGVVPSGTTPEPYPDTGIIEKCSVPGTVAITFDDGPYRFTSTLLDTLDRLGIKVTFFVNYSNWDLEQKEKDALLQRAKASGHQIASHTFTHPHLDTLSQDQVKAEMKSNDNAIRNAIGVSPRYMRPPYGEANDASTFPLLHDLGYRVINWSFATEDTNEGSSITSSLEAYRNNLDLIDPSLPGVITLQHDVIEHSAKDLLDPLINYLSTYKPGMKYVTVAQCMGDTTPYTQDPFF